MDEKQRKRFEFWKKAADEESTSPDYQYVNDKYNEALEILKWLQKKSGE